MYDFKNDELQQATVPQEPRSSEFHKKCAVSHHPRGNKTNFEIKF